MKSTNIWKNDKILTVVIGILKDFFVNISAGLLGLEEEPEIIHSRKFYEAFFYFQFVIVNKRITYKENVRLKSWEQFGRDSM